ncbi:unnamed protein product, partial [Sphacelaria rigidula]
ETLFDKARERLAWIEVHTAEEAPNSSSDQHVDATRIEEGRAENDDLSDDEATKRRKLVTLDDDGATVGETLTLPDGSSLAAGSANLAEHRGRGEGWFSAECVQGPRRVEEDEVERLARRVEEAEERLYRTADIHRRRSQTDNAPLATAALESRLQHVQ